MENERNPKVEEDERAQDPGMQDDSVHDQPVQSQQIMADSGRATNKRPRSDPNIDEVISSQESLTDDYEKRVDASSLEEVHQMCACLRNKGTIIHQAYGKKIVTRRLDSEEKINKLEAQLHDKFKEVASLKKKLEKTTKQLAAKKEELKETNEKFKKSEEFAKLVQEAAQRLQ